MKRRLAIPVLALILGLTALAPAGARAARAAQPATTRCGLSWSIVPTGFRSGSFPGASLHDVDAASATEAFAVGWKDQYTAVVIRWDGTAWRREALPPIEGRAQLWGVVDLGGGEAWAVGWSNRSFKTLVLHRSNGAWARVPSPNPNATYNVLQAVDGASANDLWAVGSDGDAVLTIHWDGAAWTKVPFPSPGTQDWATDVEAVSSDDVWLVGHTDPGSDVSLRGHWDGTAWSGAFVSSYGSLDGIDAASASDIWAVGNDSTANGDSGLIHHFNGTRWKQVAGAAPGDVGDWYLEAVASPEVGTWAVGGYSGSTGQFLDAQLWNGSTWTSIPLPYTGTNDQELASIDAGGGHLWATGANRYRTSSIMLELCPLRLTGAGLSTIASTSALGGTAVFLVPESETAPHSIADDGPLGLLDVGPIAPGDFGTHRFAVAGGYAVRDATTDAMGTIGVAPLANPSVGAPGDRFTVTWAKGPVDGLVFDVQVLRPGAASFRAWRTGVEGTSARYLPDTGAGRYLFRARARTAAGELEWSPTAAIRVTRRPE